MRNQDLFIPHFDTVVRVIITNSFGIALLVHTRIYKGTEKRYVVEKAAQINAM